MWILLTLLTTAGAADLPGSITGSVTMPASAKNETWAFIDADGPGAENDEPVVMAQVGTTFVPSVLVIPRGTTVSFPNQGSEYHNVYWVAKAYSDDLGSYRMGETQYRVFDIVDVYHIGCNIHPAMSALIRVVPNRWVTKVNPRTGTFELTGVPPGTWPVVVWSPHQNLTLTRDVDVRSGRTSVLPPATLQ